MKLKAFKVPKDGICNTPLCTDTMLPPRSAVTGEKQAKRQRHKGPPSLFFDKESLLFLFFFLNPYIYKNTEVCFHVLCLCLHDSKVTWNTSNGDVSQGGDLDSRGAWRVTVI